MDEMVLLGACGENSRPKVLVVIASYGSKNIEYLRQIIRSYQCMQLGVHIVVVSDAPKDLDSSVEVVVGLPSANPWSLPFAHKPIFARNLNHYDLFLYSEDDIEVTEQNIRAFMSATASLAEDEIAGFLRYEIDKGGTRSFPEVHGCYHWKPESAKQRGTYTIAEFTNEHAAFYLLTREQLRAAIASGGFLREPYEGRYDMLCTAATDPYTSCGFRKVICVSQLQDFLVHHLSNRYPGKFGIPAASLMPQVSRLLDISRGIHPATELFQMPDEQERGAWSEKYYEKPNLALVRSIPDTARRILSVGCGWGATEMLLKQCGALVTALPLDSVVAAEAAGAGVHLVYGNFDECMSKLGSEAFDCVVIANLLHLLPNTRFILEQCCLRVAQHGTLLIQGPNDSSLRHWVRRLLGKSEKEYSGVEAVSTQQWRSPQCLGPLLQEYGLDLVCLHWASKGGVRSMRGRLGRFNAASWILKARRSST